MPDQLCKQIFVTVRRRCDGSAWQLWELLLVANASNTIADYHLLQQLVNLRNIPVEPNHDGCWCGCLQDQLCKQIFVTVRRMCDGGQWQVWELPLVANASNTIEDYHLYQLVVKNRNIHIEPNHNRWCGCVHDLVCKQIFVYVRGRCDRCAWHVWQVYLVANASNAIADYHLMHQ